MNLWRRRYDKLRDLSDDRFAGLQGTKPLQTWRVVPKQVVAVLLKRPRVPYLTLVTYGGPFRI